jgi:hypothetical protein
VKDPALVGDFIAAARLAAEQRPDAEEEPFDWSRS